MTHITPPLRASLPRHSRTLGRRAPALVSMLLSLLLPASLPNSALADPKDDLEVLFQQLKTADSAQQARHIQQKITWIWQDSGDEEINRLFQQAVFNLNLQRLDSAIDKLSDVLRRRPDFVEAWNKRATAYYLQGDMENSLNDIRKTLELEPRHFGALHGLGMIEIHLGHLRKALTTYRRILEINPHSRHARRQLHRLEAQLFGNTT